MLKYFFFMLGFEAAAVVSVIADRPAPVATIIFAAIGALFALAAEGLIDR